MKNIKRVFVLTSLASAFIVGPHNWLSAEEGNNHQRIQMDNSKTNQRDRKSSELTADQAKNNISDRETMQAIRKSIIADKSLSTYGHNVKVIARNGHVTLKGTVHTQDEKSNIEAKACEVAGSENVTNKIRIK